jgi:hypothetical protein
MVEAPGRFLRNEVFERIARLGRENSLHRISRVEDIRRDISGISQAVGAGIFQRS